MNRRNFLKTLAGAIAAASAGMPVIAAAEDHGAPHGKRRKVNARHIFAYDITAASGHYWAHRIDVKIGSDQFSVDLVSARQALSARELGPALVVMNNRIEEFDCVIGDVRSYSFQQWLDDKDAQAKWREMR